jgi:hypothetical protein
MIGNMPEVGSGYFGMLVLDNTRGGMVSVVGYAERTAWYG